MRLNVIINVCGHFQLFSLQASDDSDDIFNDCVTLGKSTEFETVVWRFPNTDQCPLKYCMLSCSSRSVCLGHFHLLHADTTMCCTICSELISVKNPLALFRHYQDHHPKESPPKLRPVSRDLAVILIVFAFGLSESEPNHIEVF